MARNLLLLLAAGLAGCVFNVDGDGRKPGGQPGGGDGPGDDVGGDTAVDDTGDDTGADDTGDDTGMDTGDTGEAWGDCAALREPWTFENADDLWAADDALMPDIDGIASAIALAQDRMDVEAGCPTVTDIGTDVSTGFEIAGECTTADGTRYAGRMAMTITTSGMGTVTEWRFENFQVEVVDELDPYRFWADGVMTLDERVPDASTGDPGGMLVDATLTHGLDRLPESEHPGLVGEWARRIHMQHEGLSGVSMTDGYVWVVQAVEGGKTGDFCVDLAVADATGTCDTEGDGTLTFQGANEAVLTLDGSASCDGCGRLVIDGADVGMTCPTTGEEG